MTLNLEVKNHPLSTLSDRENLVDSAMDHSKVRLQAFFSDRNRLHPLFHQNHPWMWEKFDYHVCP
jgi:hypothetical protein